MSGARALSDSLLDAVATDDRVHVSHAGLDAMLTPPVGADAVEYVRDVQKLGDAVKDAEGDAARGGAAVANATLDFVAKWFVRLLDGVDCPRQAWRAFLALGGANGPVPKAMADMAGACIGMRPESVEQLPT